MVCGKSLAGGIEGWEADVHFAHYLCAFFFPLRFEFALGLVLLEPCVVLPDYSLDLVGYVSFEGGGQVGEDSYGAELAGLLCDSHIEYPLSDIRMEI